MCAGTWSDAVGDLSSAELGEEDEEIEAVIEETIEGLSDCESECEHDFKTSDHGNGHICYGMWLQWNLINMNSWGPLKKLYVYINGIFT